MREQELKPRDKKVQKMTRDGLTEQNLTQGTEQRISSRLSDASFDRTEPEEPADRFANATAPEVWGPLNAPASMRDAGDTPIMPNRPSGDSLKPPGERQRRKQKPPIQPEKQANEPEEPAAHAAGPSAHRRRNTGRREDAEKKPAQRGGRYQLRRLAQGQEPEPSTAPETMEHGRLRFGHEETRPDGGQAPDRSRQQKRFEKAQRRVEHAGQKLEKAQDKLPSRRKLRLEKQYDSNAGKVKHRLQFDKELIPENEKPPLPKRAVKAAVHGAKTAAVMKVHQKIRGVEHENVAVEAAHRGEFAAERAGGRFLRWNRQRLHTKPYRMERKARLNVSRANADMAYQQLLKDNPALQKKAFAKWIQKRNIKRRYAAAAREAQKTASHTKQVLNATGQIIRAIAQFVAANKAVLGVVALAVLIVVLCSSLFSSCAAMLSGVQSAIISTCYVTDDQDINDSELKYTELEADLQKDVDDTEANHPGYDEYRYNIGEIGHNPYELMGYLSAAYDDFTFAQVEAEINRLFGLQYQLTREETVEVRYRTETHTDADGNEYEEEVPYNWYILKTTLAVRPLGGIIAGSLAPGDQTDRYGVYMQTYGNRQCFGNPFDFAWLGYVTSPYGYRIHPISGEKNLHRGVDIGVAGGTPIKAIQDGRVVSAGSAGDYGLCVVIEDEKGYQSRYAHCSSLSVSTGQEVKRGDVIAAVGSTGSSTGPHLHLEVMHNGEYLNPYYFVDNGGDGLTPDGGAAGNPDIPDYSGEPMGDGSFEAMLHEAEKFLGYPYVWGGSSPSTSFDCSGFVSWVINQSGVGSVGRQTASGLYNLCTPVSRGNMQPGDLIFFTGTYSSPTPVSHVGIYVGGGRMIHCGDPISYANINTAYWTQHFYSGGRLP